MTALERRDRKLRQQRAEAAIALEIAAADWGRDYFKQHPNLMLVEVSREGSSRFNTNDEMIAFLRGYCEARRDHDAYKRGE